MIFLAVLFLFVHTVIALPTPHGISGYILELDGVTQVDSGTHFSVEDVTTGNIIEGVSGRGLNPGKYSVAINGNDGDTVVLRAWTEYNSAEASFVLAGVMRNVNLLLNTSLPPLPPHIISLPITTATEDYLYTYQVEATDPNDDELSFSLGASPSGMAIDENTGMINWIPSSAHIGEQSVTAVVLDGTFSDEQSYTLTVSALPQEEQPAQAQKISAPSGGGGGGSKKINATPKLQKVIIILDTDKSPVSQIVLSLRNRTDNVGVNILELPSRPKETKSLDKKVYQYLKIDKQNFQNENIAEASIEFVVEKSWLAKQNAKDNDIVLNHYTKRGWNELETENKSRDEKFVRYQSTATSFSFFAISLRYLLPLAENITVNIILTPFRLYGVAYRTETQQMPVGTPFVIENTNTGEAVDGITGIGPNSGAYSVLLHGHEGDAVTIKIGDPSYNASFSTILREDMKTINFLLNEEMGGFVPMTKENVYLSRVSNVRMIVYINSALILLMLIAALLILLKYMQGKNHAKKR